jgi:hypothetical protein
VQLSPTIQRDEHAAQYVTTIPDSTDVAFFGNRYVFAYIKTRTISLDTRINWTFSPESHAAAVRAAVHREWGVLEFQGVRKAEEREEVGVWGGCWGDLADADGGIGVGGIRGVVYGGSGWDGAGGAFHFLGSGFHYAIAARECGAAVGVSAGVDGVLRVDAAADWVRCDGGLRLRKRGDRDR